MTSTFRRLRAAWELNSNSLWRGRASPLPGEAYRAPRRFLLLALAHEQRLFFAGVDDVDQVPLVVRRFAEPVGDGTVENLGDRDHVHPVLVLALDGAGTMIGSGSSSKRGRISAILVSRLAGEPCGGGAGGRIRTCTPEGRGF